MINGYFVPIWINAMNQNNNSYPNYDTNGKKIVKSSQNNYRKIFLGTNGEEHTCTIPIYCKGRMKNFSPIKLQKNERMFSCSFFKCECVDIFDANNNLIRTVHKHSGNVINQSEGKYYYEVKNKKLKTNHIKNKKLKTNHIKNKKLKTNHIIIACCGCFFVYYAHRHNNCDT
jgi:hypothetical protein